MIGLLCALLITRVAYDFPIEVPIPYSLTVKFQGHIPVLGGQDGTVEVGLKLVAVGQKADALGSPQVRSSIEDLKMVFNGATLPLGVKNIQTFFPPTTISMTPQGKILKTDAPDVKLPVQLPGLNAKRFPDISYLPIEFPVEGVEVGHPFQFKKSFGASEVQYTVTPTKVGDDVVELKVEMCQDYTGLEDERHNPTEVESDASFRLSTHVSGQGSAVFDLKRHLVTSAHIEADAKTHVVEVKSKAESERGLKTDLSLKAQ